MSDDVEIEKWREVFQCLNDKEIEYCHWKSNEHLISGLEGNTDIDILINRNQKKELQNILNNTGFRTLETPWLYSDPATEYRICYDVQNDRYLFFHIHYRLILGGFLKEYQIPWEEKILSTRCKESDTGIYISDPNIEIILLFIRYALKIKNTDYLRSLVGGTYPSEDIIKEYKWLLERIELDKVYDFTNDLLDSKSASIILESIEKDQMNAQELKKLKGTIEDQVSIYRTYSKAGLIGREFLGKRYKKLFRKTGRKPIIIGRTPESGGYLVAVIGPDGAGKTTISKSLANWLDWKVDTCYIYMGSNDEYTNFKKIISKMRRTYDKAPKKPAFLYDSLDILWAVSISLSKRKKLLLAFRARNKGTIVITDRFPQNQVQKINDGPRLANYTDHRSDLARKLANWEQKPYSWGESNPPDVVLKLSVSPEVAFERSDSNMETVEKKCDIVDKLIFKDSQVITLDADQELEKVIADAKSAVWKEIN